MVVAADALLTLGDSPGPMPGAPGGTGPGQSAERAEAPSLGPRPGVLLISAESLDNPLHLVVPVGAKRSSPQVALCSELE